MVETINKVKNHGDFRAIKVWEEDEEDKVCNTCGLFPGYFLFEEGMVLLVPKVREAIIV